MRSNRAAVARRRVDVFGWVEVAILGLMVLVFNYIAHDGESNWLEGIQLVVLYAMAAVVFFVLPETAFGG